MSSNEPGSKKRRKKENPPDEDEENEDNATSSSSSSSSSSSVRCSCKTKQCTHGNCACLKARQACTQECSCKHCQNQYGRKQRSNNNNNNNNNNDTTNIVIEDEESDEDDIINSFDKEIQQLKGLLEEAHKKLNDTKKENNDLRQQIVTQVNSIQSLEQQVDDLSNLNTNLQTTLNTANDRVDKLRDDKVKLRNELTTRDTYVQQMDEQIQEHQQTIETLKHRENQYIIELNNTNQLLTKTNLDLSAAFNDLSTKDNEIQEHINALETCKRQIIQIAKAVNLVEANRYNSLQQFLQAIQYTGSNYFDYVDEKGNKHNMDDLVMKAQNEQQLVANIENRNMNDITDDILKALVNNTLWKAASDLDDFIQSASRTLVSYLWSFENVLNYIIPSDSNNNNNNSVSSRSKSIQLETEPLTLAGTQPFYKGHPVLKHAIDELQLLYQQVQDSSSVSSTATELVKENKELKKKVNILEKNKKDNNELETKAYLLETKLKTSELQLNDLRKDAETVSLEANKRISELVQHKQQLFDENKKLVRELTNMETEIENQRQQYNNLFAQFQILQANLSSVPPPAPTPIQPSPIIVMSTTANDALNDLQGKFDTLKSDYDELLNKNKLLDSDLQHALAEKNDKNVEINKNQETIEQLNDEKNTLETEITQLKRRFGLLQFQHDAITLQLNDMNNEKVQLTKAKDTITKENEQQKITVENLQQRITQLETEKNDAVNQASTDKLTLENDVTTLKQQVLTLETNNKNLNDEKNAFERETNQLKKRIELLQLHCDTVEKQLNDMTKAKDTINKENEQQKITVQNLQQRITQLETEKTSMDKLTLENEVKTLKQHVLTLESDKGYLTITADELQNQHDEIKKQLNDMMNKNVSLTKEKDIANQTADELKNQLTTMKQQYLNYAAQQENEIIGLQTKLRESNDVIANLLNNNKASSSNNNNNNKNSTLTPDGTSIFITTPTVPSAPSSSLQSPIQYGVFLNTSVLNPIIWKAFLLKS
jgi:chromosome segregation ATPase